MYSFQKMVLITAIGGFLSFCNFATQAGVISITSLAVSQEGVEGYEEVMVRCAGLSDSRIIVYHPRQENLWCPKELAGDFCNKNKLTVANSVCSSKYKKKLAEVQDAKQSKARENIEIKAELKLQEDKIREQLVALEQRKLSIIKREIDLENRELELKRRQASSR